MGRRVDPLAATLAEAAEQFVVTRRPTEAGQPSGTSLIAGYHWFTEYIRDALIAMPGILLGDGRVADAVTLLRVPVANIKAGMVPSHFSEYGTIPEYDSVDAGLFLFTAVRDVLHAGADRSLLSELYPGLREIVQRYSAGTCHGIGADPRDGLLRAGEHRDGRPPTHLTWMNAHQHEHVYTPRIGKPIEVNALWIEALALITAWASEVGDDPGSYRRMLELGRVSFAERFWYEEGGYLYDVIDGPDGHDSSLRPNQLFALSLLSSLIGAARSERALAAVEEHLLTPYGLRSLSPDDPHYIGRCAGDREAQDRAFHQGTVWPWLLGPYVDAHRQVRGRLPDLDLLLDPFVDHLREAGLGTVSQIFDGDAPHTPRGCIAQAWSVAELLRLARLAQS
jgi:predicted glycogen debranching enzyme